MGLLGKIGRLMMDVVETPIAAIKDTLTLGGELSDQKTPYTKQKIDDIGKDWENLKDEIDKK